MTTKGRKLILSAIVLAAGCLATAPVLAAANDKAKGGKSKQEQGPPPDAEALRKYDRNGNGKLDPDEEAAMKADQAKQRGGRNKKNEQGGT